MQARYVRFKIAPARILTVSEVEVLNFMRSEPFDLRVALPDSLEISQGGARVRSRC